MRQYIPVITLAMLVALAAGALSGGLLPSENVVRAQTANENPEFDSGLPTSLSVDENTPPGTNIGDPFTATDADEDTLEFGDPLTYSLEGQDAASFDIDKSTGQLITKAALQADGANAKLIYIVNVKVEDSRGGEDTLNPITIRVENDNEPPAAPMAPTVVSGEDSSSTTDADESTTTLKMIWHEPENMGPDIDGYEVQYKKTTDASYALIQNISGTATTISPTDGLEAATVYQVRVRATSGESDNTDGEEIAPWSLTGTGSTNKAGNGAPSFDENGEGTEGTLTRRVVENEPAREEVGTEVRANAHVDDNALTYQLGGPDADLFDIDPSSGQLRTKAPMNHEDPRCYVENDDNTTSCFYYVTVSVFDGQGASDARPVKIDIRDRSEAPDAPARPTVRASEKSSRSLDVSWTEPRNPGPPITGYEIRYRKGTSGNYATIEDITGTKATIAPEDVDERLLPHTLYEVHVKAYTDERHSPWSALTTGITSTGNRDAIFNDRHDNEAAKTDRTIARTVNENTQAGQNVGLVVTARDRDSLTYKLVAAEAPNAGDFNKFAINDSTGQILTKEPLNTEAECSAADSALQPGGHRENCTYLVRVEVSDGLDEHGNKEEGGPADNAAAELRVDDRITVRIIVGDVKEVPAAPNVTVTSLVVAPEATEAELVVAWSKPENTGPAIDGYVVECTGDGITTSNPCPQPTNPDLNTGEQSYTITGLTPNSSYRVRLRARNAEGLGHVVDVSQPVDQQGG